MRHGVFINTHRTGCPITIIDSKKNISMSKQLEIEKTKKVN